MCGLCGIVDFRDPPPRETTERMARTLRHRGPDAFGIAVAGPAGLGHTRLAILDLSESGSQPMWSDNRRYCLAYNGELYNAPELRDELEADGFRFRGHSDTEVVLVSLIRDGVSALARFNGMFALALWDRDAEQLLLARDRFGIKPLYYLELPHSIVFGSEIKAILASGRGRTAVSGSGLHEYMYYGNALGERTLFENIRKVLPGTWRLFDHSGARSKPFWAFSEVQPTADGDPQALLGLLSAAVRRHLLSDVPVGAMLSGGVDSSAIVALASGEVGDALRTFTVGFDFPGAINEFEKARVVANRFGTDHTEIYLHGASVPELLERLIRIHDQPFGDAANLPLLMISDELRGSVKVILQGDGGDELFGGYLRYNLLAHARLWKGLAALRPLSRRLARLPFAARVDRLLYALGQPDGAQRMALLLTQERPNTSPLTVLQPQLRSVLTRSDPFARYRAVAQDLHCNDPLQLMLWTDASILLPDIFLEKVDRPMMANGIEVRVPFLDAELTRYVLGLPSREKATGFQKKRVLRRALRSILPDEILDGPKTGFGVPYGEWLRRELAGYAQERLSAAAGPGNLFDRERVLYLLEQHLEGSANHEFLLYKCLGLALWRDAYLPDDGFEIAVDTGLAATSQLE